MEIDRGVDVISVRKFDELMKDWLSQTPNLYQQVTKNVDTSSSSIGKSPLSPPSSKKENKSQTLSPKAQSHSQKENRDPNSPTTTRLRKSSPPVSPGQRGFQKKQKLELLIPPFYFPKKKAPSSQYLDKEIEWFRNGLRTSKSNNASGGGNGDFMIRKNDFAILLMEICQFPTFISFLIFDRLDSSNSGLISQTQFFSFWKSKMIYPDTESRIFHFLKQESKKYLYPEDFIPVVRNIISTHAGLEFLKDVPVFQERYLETVIVRMFYRSCGAKKSFMSLDTFRQSLIVQELNQLDSDENINNSLSFFSYEHFYVIYCKFWELDKEHQLKLVEEDLYVYDNNSLSSKIIHQIFSQQRFKMCSNNMNMEIDQKQKIVSYQDFVWFLISEEDKYTDTSIQYWFSCLDSDGDGYLSIYELENFYSEQIERLQRMNIDPIPFQDILCQILDIVKPKDSTRITLSDLRKCKQCSHIFNMLFNVPKFLSMDDAYSDRTAGNDNSWNHHWNAYASAQFELLASNQ